MVSPYLFVLVRGLRVDRFDGDAVRVGRWIEGEGIVAERWCKVPAQNLAMLRLCIIRESSDHQLSRKQIKFATIPDQTSN